MPVTIAEIGFAPGKGMVAYDDVASIEIDDHGLFGDRHYMWVEAEPHKNELYHHGEIAEPGHFLSMREDPGLTQIIPILEAQGGVSLSTRNTNEALYVPGAADTNENRTPVSVWSWHGEAVDQGDEAAAWGTIVIGRPVRLVAVSDEKPRFVEGDKSLGRVGFADAYPFTVGSTRSVELVNQQLEAAGVDPITYRRPRVSLLLDGLELPNADKLSDAVFPEDYVDEIAISSNGLTVVLKRIKACGRCPVPNTDEITGVRRGAPVTKALGALARGGRHTDTGRYGEKPELFWTQNFVVKLPDGMEQGQTIQVNRGAEVAVTYSADTNWN